ncbi:DUF4932 domain-containing protein [Niabella ginsengisoli]|uniref:DUF4932 domain-containing protein n=1 Tax=Niabella ginsengisoli TaxID=522298 RepID=UPI00374CDECD
MVRACAIQYLKDHHASQSEIDLAINKEIEKSFLWMPAFVELIAEYNNNRKKYPTLESFYPNLIQGFVDASNNIPALLKLQETVK